MNTNMINILTITIIYFNILLTFCNSQRWPLTGTCHPCECQIYRKGYGREKYVNCSNLYLNTIPENLPLDLNTLDLSFNIIPPSELKQLCAFKALHNAILSHNELVHLPKYTFENCHDLLHLNLTGNKITLLERQAFNGMENVRGIYGLQVDEMVDDAFRELTNLKTLEIIYNGDVLAESVFDGLTIQNLKLTVKLLQSLPNKLLDFGVKTLNELSITGPKISFLSENTFRGLAVLRKIYLDLQELVSLPERIFHNNGKLEILSSKPENLLEIWILNVKSIPTEIFKDLENLNKLVLRGIYEIPKSSIFSDLLNLEYLDITESNVNQISKNWFAKLYSLKTLNLRHTGIRTIEPGVLSGLINLQELDLSFNVLRQIDTESLKPIVHSVKTINLHGNMLKTVHSSQFQNMYNLVALDISDNKLESIDEDALVDLRQLIRLDIHDNKLSKLPDEVFKNLRNLQTLNLALNTFIDFPAALEKSGYLLNLDFSNNQISQLPPNILESFPFLEWLNLDRNPLHCDCDSLRIGFNQPNLVIVGTCRFPEKFARMSITDINVEECMKQSSVSSHVSTLETDVFTLLPNSVESSLIMQSSLFSDFTSSIAFSHITTSPMLITSELPPRNDYFSTVLQPTLPTLIGNVTDHFPPSISVTRTVYTNPSEIYTSHIPPIIQEEKSVEKLTDNMLFRVVLGVVSGALFICGFIAVVLWSKRARQKKRYEVTAVGNTVI